MSRDFAEPAAVVTPTPRQDDLVEVNPKIPLLRGPWEVLRSLHGHRHLAMNFISRDIRLKYRDSALGYIWTLLEPLLLTGVYYVLYVLLAHKADHKYPLLVILGVITWQLWSKALSGALACITKNESMIKQVFFPRELFALTTVGSQLAMSALSLLVAVPLMIYFRVAPTLYLVMVPLGLLLAALIALGLGLILACVNVVYRDVEHMVKFLTRTLLFLSPVMWTMAMVPKNRAAVASYVRYNPMTVPIELVRNGVLGKPLGLGAGPVVASVAFAVGTFVIGAIVFKRYEAEMVKKL